MAGKTPLEERAEWRERQVRGLEEGDARLRQLRQLITPAPRLPVEPAETEDGGRRARREPAPVHEPSRA